MSEHLAPTVLVACDDLVLLDEVIRHLEEIPRWRLVSAARSAAEVSTGMKASRPDFVLVADSLAVELAGSGILAGEGVVIFGTQPRTDVLRAALKLGARGFVLWPQERAQLRGMVEEAAAEQAAALIGGGALHAVWAPKGGAGATVIAAHLAACLARLGSSSGSFPGSSSGSSSGSFSGSRCVLVDLDLDNGDQATVLNAGTEYKSVLDLLRVADEVSSRTVDSVAWHHPGGFRVILSPAQQGQSEAADPCLLNRVVDAIGQGADHVVVDVPSGISRLSTAVLQQATTISLVVTPDVLGLKRARAAVQALRSGTWDPGRIYPVLNQAGGPDISSKEVETVLELHGATRVRADLQIYRSANRGELSPLACRMLAPLASRLLESSGFRVHGSTAPRGAPVLTGAAAERSPAPRVPVVREVSVRRRAARGDPNPSGNGWHPADAASWLQSG